MHTAVQDAQGRDLIHREAACSVVTMLPSKPSKPPQDAQHDRSAEQPLPPQHEPRVTTAEAAATAAAAEGHQPPGGTASNSSSVTGQTSNGQGEAAQLPRGTIANVLMASSNDPLRGPSSGPIASKSRPVAAELRRIPQRL